MNLTSSPRAAMSRQLLVMVVSVAAICAVAIGLYYMFDLKRAAPSTQRIFTVVWMLADSIAVLFPLKQIRNIRRDLHRRGRG